MKDDKLYLIHVSECIERVEKYVSAGGKDEFMASEPAYQYFNAKTIAPTSRTLKPFFSSKSSR
jgi:uncharacterized protein with HEPN domain